jgi:uncharacterized protein (DUF305 family)
MAMKTSIAAILLLNIFLLSACVDKRNAHEADITTLPEAPKDSLGNPKMIMDNDLMHALSGTMAEMNQLEMSGAFDLDFANMMILHHQAAIDMSKIEIAQGRDEQIIEMAQSIQMLQTAQIGQMEQFVNDYKLPVVKTGIIREQPILVLIMNGMMNKMNNMAMTGHTDQDFIAMMIPHHRAAVAMAENQLRHGKDLELKKLAQQMIVDQNSEIEEFKAWLINHK